LRIKDVEFAGAVAKPGGPVPGELPEVAFSGRSNVGKSSLINRLLGRTRTPIARVSQTPGKTQEINFYRVRTALESGREAAFFLVDLPGYGYAKVPLVVRGAWRPLIESYLGGSEQLRGIVQLIDARHDPTNDDLRMIEYLAETGHPTVIVLTKMDKLKPSERKARVARTSELLGVDSDQVIPFSSKTGEGREVLLESLEALLEEETR